MSITTTINLKERLVHHQVDGHISFDEVVAAIEGLFKDPEFSTEMNIIAEIMPGSMSDLSSDDIHNIVKRTRGMNNRKGPGKTVVVVTSDSDYGVFHVLEYLLKDEERELRVVRSLSEAERWLKE